MKRTVRYALVFAAALFTAPVFAAGGVFVVNTGTTDLGDKTPGDGACADINGKCSLRAAIEEGNALAGATALTPHAITFSVPQVAVINGGLTDLRAPFIVTGPAIVNGTGNAFAHGCFNLNDSGTAGLGYVDGATGTTITLLSIVNCSGDGISGNGHGYKLIGNFIGTDPTGLIKMSNAGSGIALSASKAYGNVDTSSLADLFAAFPQLPVQESDINSFATNLRTALISLNPDIISGNVISSNGGDGIYIHSESLAAVFVSGNMIGTDITGNIAMGNGGAGVHVNAATFGNMIGPGNTIAANMGDGVKVDTGTVYLPNFVMGNRIGIATADPLQHIGNAGYGVSTDAKPDGSLTNKNPTGMSLVVGPANVISDNQLGTNGTEPDTLGADGAGVIVTGASNGVKITGNTIGMADIPVGTAVQSTAYGNAGDGVTVTVTGNTVSGNVIAGNKRHGILVKTASDTSTRLLGNTIGLNPAFPGDLTLGNGFDGIHIDSASSSYIGGPNNGDANTIAANGRNGVKILHGGTANGWANLIQRNVIYANARGNPNALPVALPPGIGVGIDLDHTEDATDGPHDEFPGNYVNLDQAPPVICTGAPGEPTECAGFTAPASFGGMTTFDWTIKTHGPASFRAEFFQIEGLDGNTSTSMQFLGEQADIQTDASGNLSGAGCSATRCTATVAANAAGAHIVMTITDITALLDTPQNGGDWKGLLTCFVGDIGLILPSCTANNTSEFSNAAALPLNNNASLANLMVSTGTLTPSFAANTLAYTDAVQNTTTSITVTSMLADPSATQTVNGVALANGGTSASIALVVGMNPIPIVVTAQDGTTTQTYTVTVNRAAALSNNAALSNLLISVGALTPSFASATLDYSDSVSNATTSINVTPTTADATATIKVNGTTVASGSASSDIALVVGPNPIGVVVTAQDGTTVQTYTVTVNRASPTLSNNAALSALTISAGTLTPAFASNTLTYSDAVANAITSATVTPTTADANATITVNTLAVTSGSPSQSIALAVGMNPIVVVVTAQDGTTTQTYTITVNRASPALSNNAALSNLAISASALTPAFLSTTLNYTDAVANATASITVTPTAADANATIKVNGASVASGSASAGIPLVVGPNTVTVLVTAQDGTTVQTYTITVNRASPALSNNAALSNLAISSGTLTPSFVATTLNYADAVSNATAAITVTPTASDINATIKVNGASVASGSASAGIPLVVGPNTITVLVTAQDGSTTQSYVITVNRATPALSNNAALSNLAISAGSLTPSFVATTLAYTDAVSNATASLTVTPTAADANATIQVNGVSVASGSASGALALAVGANPVSVVVTAQDGTTTQTYTIAVNRASPALSNNAALSNLAVSVGSLTPSFLSTTLNYTDAVSNATASITITPTAADANATIKVNGASVASGSASAGIPLVVGPNTITVLVTAQDGTTTQAYTITVNRASPASSNNAALSNLAVSAGTLTPSFVATTLNYSDAVPNATASITVTPTAADANATIQANGIAVASGSASGAIALSVGANPINVVITAQDGTTIQTYAISVNRASPAQSNNAALANLTVSAGALTPSFASATLNYTDAVTNATSSITVTPTTADANATVQVNGVAVASGSASGAIALIVGSNPINVVVTAQDGTTTQMYMISIDRASPAQSNNAALSNLIVSAGALTPSFGGTTLSYSDNVANATASIALTATTSDANATLTINGSAVASGSASAPIALIVGSNPISVIVTAQNGTTTQTYTVAVIRANVVVTTFSGPSATGTGTISATLSGGGAACSIASASLVSPPAAPPSNVTFPDGLFQFSVSGCTGSITMTVTFPTAFTGAEKYWKYGPTSGQASAHWYMLGAANDISLVGHTATFTIADGGLGDDDLSANGTIVDAGGPGVTAAGPGNGTAAVPVLSDWAIVLLAVLIAVVGRIVDARRHKR
jgi:Cadherin-like beta sandwich domain